jgi:hypothetical protein
MVERPRRKGALLLQRSVKRAKVQCRRTTLNPSKKIPGGRASVPTSAQYTSIGYTMAVGVGGA